LRERHSAGRLLSDMRVGHPPVGVKLA